MTKVNIGPNSYDVLVKAGDCGQESDGTFGAGNDCAAGRGGSSDKPKGAPGKDKDKQKEQQQTPEFKQWFRDSKVVDKQGNPLVVYHGTDLEFDEFKDVGKSNSRLLGDGFYFASDKQQAQTYGKNVYEVYLRIENPRTDLSDGEQVSLPPKDSKYDGAIVAGLPGATASKPVYFVKDPKQIKSSTDNDGSFDTDEANTTKSYCVTLKAGDCGQIDDGTFGPGNDCAAGRGSSAAKGKPAKRTTSKIAGNVLETGKPIEVPFVRNTESATEIFGKPNKDSPYDRGYEPAGEYFTPTDKEQPAFAGMISGTIKFQNPLVLDAGEYGESTSWKRSLSEQYGGLTGGDLSQAVIDDGYDAIFTVGKYGPSEAINLQTFDPDKVKSSKSYTITVKVGDCGQESDGTFGPGNDCAAGRGSGGSDKPKNRPSGSAVPYNVSKVSKKEAEDIIRNSVYYEPGESSEPQYPQHDEVGPSTGFLLEDGTPIQYAPYGESRYEDHRIIAPAHGTLERMGATIAPEALSFSGRTAAMYAVMESANAVRVHVDPGHVMIDKVGKLTPSQRRRMLAAIREYKPDTVALDFHDPETGKTRYGVYDGFQMQEIMDAINFPFDDEGGLETKAYKLIVKVGDCGQVDDGTFGPGNDCAAGRGGAGGSSDRRTGKITEQERNDFKKFDDQVREDKANVAVGDEIKKDPDGNPYAQVDQEPGPNGLTITENELYEDDLEVDNTEAWLLNDQYNQNKRSKDVAAAVNDYSRGSGELNTLERTGKTRVAEKLESRIGQYRVARAAYIEEMESIAGLAESDPALYLSKAHRAMSNYDSASRGLLSEVNIADNAMEMMTNETTEHKKSRSAAGAAYDALNTETKLLFQQRETSIDSLPKDMMDWYKPENSELVSSSALSLRDNAIKLVAPKSSTIGQAKTLVQSHTQMTKNQSSALKSQYKNLSEDGTTFRVYRGIPVLSPATKRIYDEIIRGDNKFQVSGYGSTSIRSSVANNFIRNRNPGILFRINTKKGIWVEPNTNWEGEQEVLFPPNTEFRITEKQLHHLDGVPRLIVDMEPIDD